MRNTFARIREDNVRLRRDKCHFGYSFCEGDAEVYRKSELLSGLHAKSDSDRRTSIPVVPKLFF